MFCAVKKTSGCYHNLQDIILRQSEHLNIWNRSYFPHLFLYWQINSAWFYAHFRKKRMEIVLWVEHGDDEVELSSDEDEEQQEYLPGENETGENQKEGSLAENRETGTSNTV